MTARKKASVAGARRVTANLDNLATLFQTYGGSLGIPSRVAADFAYRCDLLSDAIERHVGASKQARFNPAEIGEEVPGPLDMLDSDEPWMDGHFTQEKFNALEEKQESGELAANAAAHKADPKLAALIQKAAMLAADRAARAVLAKKAEEEVEEEAEEAPAADKKAKKAEPDPEKTTEDKSDAEEAAKTAALFGLFSAR